MDVIHSNSKPLWDTHTCVGPPLPPPPPGVVMSNLVTLVVSWTAPWSLPVSSYILRMTDTSSLALLGLWITNCTQVLVDKTQQSECNLMDFTVEAMTDVGSTGASHPTIAGFPITKCTLQYLYFSECTEDGLHCAFVPKGTIFGCSEMKFLSSDIAGTSIVLLCYQV